MKPLVNKKFRLEKFPGKGGWTFAAIPGIKEKQNKPFGYIKVRGFIDDYEIRKYHLMPRSNGDMMLPVNARIRKAIKKGDGDLVMITLYPDTEPLEVPEEMLLCLADEPEALRFFNTLSESEQKFYINWIYSAKREETKTDRMAKSINKLQHGLKLYDNEGKML
jgi:hypothetical protein